MFCSLCYNSGQAVPATAFSNFSQLIQILTWSVAVPSAKAFFRNFSYKKNSLPSDFCRLKWCSFLVWATQLDGQFFALNTLGSAFNWPEIWLVLSTWLYCPLCRFFNVIYLIYPLLAPFVRIFVCRKNSELPISLCQWPKFRFFIKFFTQMFKYEPQIFYTQIFPKFVLFWKNCTTLYNFFPNFLSLDQKQAQFVPKWQNYPDRSGPCDFS